MNVLKTVNVGGIALLGSLALQALPAAAAPAPAEARPLVLIASGGWATRAEGKRSTYDDPYYGYGYGYGGGYGYGRGYAAPDYAYGPAPYGYGDEDEYGDY